VRSYPNRRLHYLHLILIISELCCTWERGRLARTWERGRLACTWERGRLARTWERGRLACTWERGRLARTIADVDVRAPMRSLPSRKSKFPSKKSNVSFFCPKPWDKSVDLPHNRPKPWDKPAELPRERCKVNLNKG